MIRLSDSIERLSAELRTAITSVSQSNGPAEVLCLHTHPNYGQIHIYLSWEPDVQSWDLVGGPISGAIDLEDWADEWHAERPSVVLLDGTSISPESQDQFHCIIAEHVAQIATVLRETLEPALNPKRLLVESESGEFRGEW